MNSIYQATEYSAAIKKIKIKIKIKLKKRRKGKERKKEKGGCSSHTSTHPPARHKKQGADQGRSVYAVGAICVFKN